MTKKELGIVRQALQILENEFYEQTEEEKTDKLKPFKFIGSRETAMAFYNQANKFGIRTIVQTLSDTDVYNINSYIVTSKPLNQKKYDILEDLKIRIEKTMNN